MQSSLLLVLLLAVAHQGVAQDEPVADAAAPAAPDAPAADAAPQEPTEGGEEAPVVPIENVGEAPCRCPTISTQHYFAKSCAPIIDDDKCCPVRYNCTSEAARGIALTSCLYGDKTYAVGEDVPVVGPCRRGCKCRQSLSAEEPAKIECAVVDCSSVHGQPKPGCRPMYSIDQCCEVSQECSVVIPESEILKEEEVTLRGGDCFAEGLEYYIGDKIFFSKSPCQQCVCTEGFAGPQGPNCTTIDCGMEYRDRTQLREGCTPLYLNGSCCSTDWFCPGSPHIITDPQLAAKGDEDPTTHCKLGVSVTPVGGALSTYNCHISCSCITPPDFTCVQYATCEVALAAQRAGEAP